MKKLNFTTKYIVVAIIFWVIDTILDKYVNSEEFFEFIPTEPSELWMRVIIVILLVFLGIYADRHTKTLIEKEKEDEILIIYTATIKSTQHILNNLLHQLAYFNHIAKKKETFTDEDLEKYETVLKQGQELVKKLSSVEELTEQNIINSVHPKHNT